MAVTKGSKVSGTKKKHLEEHLATNWINRQKDSDMTVLKINLTEKKVLRSKDRQRLTNLQKTAEQFQNNVPRCKIVKSLRILSSTVNLLKRF